MGLSQKNIAALEGRAIDVELATRLGVSDATKRGFDIEIPYFFGGEVVNHKYRTLSGEKKFCQDANAKKIFYNIDCLLDSDYDGPLYITEGELDAMVLMQCGHSMVLSVPDGAPQQEIHDPEATKYDFVHDAMPLVKRFKRIILCTDGDGPGLNLRNDLSLILGKARCMWVPYPKGTKDLNQVFEKWGEAGVTKVLERAKYIDVDGIFRLSELPQLPEARRHTTGLEKMDQHYNVRLGDLAVLTGLPSAGKSTFINNLATNMVKNYQWRIAYAPFEQRPQLDGRRNLRTLHSGKMERDMSVEELEEADAWINKHFYFIVPSLDDDVTLEWMLEKASTAVVRHECKMVIVDPWNEMDHDRDPGESETEYTGRAIKRFKKFAAKHWIHMMIAAHPAKMQRNREGKYPRVSMYDIAGSAHFNNKPDVGIILHKQDDTTEIEIAKSRYHDQIGYPGSVKYRYSQVTGRYYLADDELI